MRNLKSTFVLLSFFLPKQLILLSMTGASSDEIAFRECLAAAGSVVVLAGAGLSAGSGRVFLYSYFW